MAVTTKGKEVTPINRINKPAKAHGTYVPRKGRPGAVRSHNILLEEEE
jgi:hypothetical protein